MDIWGLLDSIVKIAMGGAVSAVTTYWILRRHTNILPDPRFTRRLDLLEQVSEQVGRVNHAFLKYATLIGEVLAAPERVTHAKKEELDSVTAELVSAFEGMSMSEARLMLLGERQLEVALRLYSARVAQFRMQFLPGRPDVQEADLAGARRDIAAAREQFYQLLSERYDKDLDKLGG